MPLNPPECILMRISRYCLALFMGGTLFLAACGQSDSSNAALPHDPEDVERIEHFKGLAAPDWATAVAHLQEYNQQLTDILARQDLGHEDMDRVHQLTYTLENAVERIQGDLQILADALEEVHLASESDDVQRLRSNAAIYLEHSQRLTLSTKQ